MQLKQILIASSAILLGISATSSHAQAYPAKTIRMIVPIAAGGGTDTMARLISQKLAEQMNVTVFVDNRPGGGTVIGTEYFSKTPPDGYTLMTVAPEFSIQPSLRKVPYDPIKDFSFITQLTSGQYFLTTHPTVPVKTAKQFIALVKERPGQVTFASSGNGSANHLAGVLFQHMTGTKMIHVPYKGAGPAGIALLGGEIDFMFSNVASAIPYVRSGKLRAIASTGEKRSGVTPDVPTIAESAVPGFVVTGFFIMMAPAGTPRDIITRVNGEAVKALQSTAFKERLSALGLDAIGNSPEAATKFIQAEITKWAPVVKAAGMKTD
ncbi:MAG: tripartite tricarboxylate transporter substrate binding protein [Burkholderiales bacterium]|jgi:tripartite-type tricarboxylate transporter receptor subunit TctC|nr:tripartite tricarboxylate transporter substrate binding protein [Burkholderiales bacterium]